jgi:hypothetical protein
MDPNETLKRIRQIAGRFEKGQARNQDGPELADLIDALDGWISRGGFLPRDWARAADKTVQS